MPPAPAGATLTTLQIVNTASAAQTNVPLTFGQVFINGAFPANTGLAGRYNGSLLPLQVNVKATHADGSVRHAVISAILPQLNAGQTATLALTSTATAAAAAPADTGNTPGQVLAGFNTVVNVTVGGQVYSAAVAPLLKLDKYSTWLAGPVASEWLASMPLTSAAKPATRTPRLVTRPTCSRRWRWRPPAAFRMRPRPGPCSCSAPSSRPTANSRSLRSCHAERRPPGFGPDMYACKIPRPCAPAQQFHL